MITEFWVIYQKQHPEGNEKHSKQADTGEESEIISVLSFWVGFIIDFLSFLFFCFLFPALVYIT